jgi:hypothetical protein
MTGANSPILPFEAIQQHSGGLPEPFLKAALQQSIWRRFI